MTFVAYGALGSTTFLLIVHLQTDLAIRRARGWRRLIPITVLMFLFSARSGALAQRIGPRLPMTVGPLIAGAARAARPGRGQPVLLGDGAPGGAGARGRARVSSVAPLTLAVLGAVDDHHAGVGSAINFAVSRIAGLLAIRGAARSRGPRRSRRPSQPVDSGFGRGDGHRWWSGRSRWGALAWVTVRDRGAGRGPHRVMAVPVWRTGDAKSAGARDRDRRLGCPAVVRARSRSCSEFSGREGIPMRRPPNAGSDAQRVEEIVVGGGEGSETAPLAFHRLQGSGVEPRLSSPCSRQPVMQATIPVRRSPKAALIALARPPEADRTKPGITAGRAEDQDGSDGKDGGAADRAASETGGPMGALRGGGRAAPCGGWPGGGVDGPTG